MGDEHTVLHDEHTILHDEHTIHDEHGTLSNFIRHVPFINLITGFHTCKCVCGFMTALDQRKFTSAQGHAIPCVGPAVANCTCCTRVTILSFAVFDLETKLESLIGRTLVCVCL